MACQQLYSVWQDINDGLQRLHCAVRTAGQVQDQRPSTHPTHAAAEDRERGLRQPSCTNLLRYAVDLFGTHCSCGLGRDIACGDTRSADGDNKLHLLAPVRQSCFNFGLIVGNDFLMSDLEAVLAQQAGRRRAREIGPLASGTGIADGENGGRRHKL